MKITVIGTGYVGLVTGVGLSNAGNDVLCMDIDEHKVNQLKKGISPIYEPGLETLMEKNIREERLLFTTSIKDAINFAEIIFIAVGTPPGEDGSADLQYVKQVAVDIGKNINNYKVIVNKSTVPIGTVGMVTNIIQNEINKRSENCEFDVVSNPEFLREGAAVEDFLKPDRIIIGTNSDKAIKIMKKLYRPFVITPEKILEMDPFSSEMSKYAANAMLATKISFMNEIAKICEKTGADVTKVKNGIGSDPRIGQYFINAGIGYGGSCFPKDVKALKNIAKINDCEPLILDAVDQVNKLQREFFFNKILKHFNNDIKNKTFAIWGLSFKPETDDTREAPSIDIIHNLLKHNSIVKGFDPKGVPEMKEEFSNQMIYEEDNMYHILDSADALIILTEWKEFYSPDFEKIKTLLKNPIIFDARNIFSLDEMKELGFKYISIGRKTIC